MTTLSDIVKKLISQKGYKSPLDFCRKTGITYRTLMYALEHNYFTVNIAQQLSEKLDSDLSFVVIAKIGSSEND